MNDDKDLCPCPYCRGEMVVCISNEWVADMFWVECFSCEMKGPRAGTADEARQVYNVVEKLVDDVINVFSVHIPERDKARHDLIVEFMQARREHPPY